jgi:urate oxidase
MLLPQSANNRAPSLDDDTLLGICSQQADSVFFNTPNLHFIPVNPMTSSFKNDVYWATSEPHGNIECVVTRSNAPAHVSKL